MGTSNKKGRGIGITVNELMNSVRLKLAVANFENDPMLLKAILTELCLEVFTATKHSLTRIVGKAYGRGWEGEDGSPRGTGLYGYEMTAYLRGLNVDDVLNNMNIYWSLTKEEAALYAADPQFKLSPEERAELFAKIKKRFQMGD